MAYNTIKTKMNSLYIFRSKISNINDKNKGSTVKKRDDVRPAIAAKSENANLNDVPNIKIDAVNLNILLILPCVLITQIAMHDINIFFTFVISNKPNS